MNLYKILPAGDVNKKWFGVIVNQRIEDCRTSLDGRKVLLKLPDTIKIDGDVPNGWKQLYLDNKPYLKIGELAELDTPEWAADLPD